MRVKARDSCASSLPSEARVRHRASRFTNALMAETWVSTAGASVARIGLRSILSYRMVCLVRTLRKDSGN